MKKAIILGLSLAFIAGLALFAVGVETARAETIINSISPTSGPIGTEVTISGTNLGEDCGAGIYCTMEVHFGEGAVGNHPPMGIVSWTDTQIIVEVPQNSTTTPIRVIYYNQSTGLQYDVTGPTFTVDNTQRYIDSISPTSGTVGTQVTINGSGFEENCGGGLYCNMWVFFGDAYIHNHPGIGLISWSDTQIVVEVPSGATTAPIRAAYYYDPDGPDPGAAIAYNITGPTFIVISPSVNVNSSGSEISTNQNINTTTPTTTKAINNKYGCEISTTAQNEKTIKLSSSLVKDSDTDKYLSQVYNAYYNTWSRYPRCSEMQFHLDHSTPIERLQNWLTENVSATQTGDDYMQTADIKLVEKGTTIIQKEDKKLEFKKDDKIALSGIATPNSTVKITISSNAKTYFTTTNNEGYWTYTITDEMETGSHSASVEILDKDGQEISKSEAINFSIIATAKAATQGDEEETEGISLTTVVIIIVAALIAVVLLTLLARKKSAPPVEKK